MLPFLRIALGFYLLCTSLGVLLRLSFVMPVPGLNFTHALHAHSHALYFGFAALSLLALVYSRLDALGRTGRAVLGAVVLISATSFGTFLHGGYSRPSIIVSALSLPLWFTAAGYALHRMKGREAPELGFFRGGAFFLILSGVLALGRVVVLVAKVEDPLWARLSVFGFLHCFALFFLLTIIGLLVAEADELGFTFDSERLRTQLRWTLALAGLTFPLGVSGTEGTTLEFVAKGATLLLVYPSLLWLWQLARATKLTSGATRFALASLGGWWAVKLVMELFGVFGAASWAVENRHPAILFLHVVSVGIVSGAILFFTFRRLGLALLPGLVLHHAGLAVMAVGLLGATAYGIGWGGLVGPSLALTVPAGGMIVGGVLFTLLRGRSASAPRALPQGLRTSAR